MKRGREGWMPSNSSIFCSRHFQDNDFDRCSSLRVYLKDSVIQKESAADQNDNLIL